MLWGSENTNRLSINGKNGSILESEAFMNRKTFFLSIFLLLTGAVLSIFAITQESKNFNDLGMQMYDEGHLIEAGESFIRAVETGPDNYLAVYNLACVLTLLREKYDPRAFAEKKRASYDIYLETIFAYLERAAALNSGRKERMIEDQDLISLRRDLRFHLTAGRKLTNGADAPLIFPAVEWRLDAADRFGGSEDPPEGNIVFGEDGSFQLDLPVYDLSASGSVFYRNGSVVLRFRDGNAGRKDITAVLTEDGAVIPGVINVPLIMRNVPGM